MLSHYDPLLWSASLGSPLCSCCVPDPMGLSFLPPYGCQSNRTASVAALRMKAREHSEAVLQSANLLATGSTTGPAAGPALALSQNTGGDSSPNSSSSKITSLRRTPDKHLHCQKEGPDKKWGILGRFVLIFPNWRTLFGWRIYNQALNACCLFILFIFFFLSALTHPGQERCKVQSLLVYFVRMYVSSYSFVSHFSSPRSLLLMILCFGLGAHGRPDAVIPFSWWNDEWFMVKKRNLPGCQCELT